MNIIEREKIIYIEINYKKITKGKNMPYIAIKAYKKSEEIKKKVVDQINDIFLKEWGCSPEAISISIEEFSPDEFEEKVQKNWSYTQKRKNDDF